MPLLTFASDLKVDIKTNLVITSVEEPPVRKAGGKVQDVDELISKLKGEAAVL
jgi:electron transfer flavoprotein beta subunit